MLAVLATVLGEMAVIAKCSGAAGYSGDGPTVDNYSVTITTNNKFAATASASSGSGGGISVDRANLILVAVLETAEPEAGE